MRNGEIVNADWWQIMYAALGANVFYFLSAPVWRLTALSRLTRSAAPSAKGTNRVSGAGHFRGSKARRRNWRREFWPIRPCLRAANSKYSRESQVNARNRVFLILGLLTIGSLILYLVTVRPTSDLQLIGTVDANEVLVSSQVSQDAFRSSP